MKYNNELVSDVVFYREIRLYWIAAIQSEFYYISIEKLQSFFSYIILNIAYNVHLTPTIQTSHRSSLAWKFENIHQNNLSPRST